MNEIRTEASQRRGVEEKLINGKLGSNPEVSGRISPLVKQGLSPIICGMSAIGKSHLANAFPGLFVDLESSQFQWEQKEDGSFKIGEDGRTIQKANWQEAYIEAALEIASQGKIPLLSFQPKVFEELRNRGLEFDIVIHNENSKKEVVQRLRDRTNDSLNKKTSVHDKIY
jgi:hypothetical protein